MADDDVSELFEDDLLCIWCQASFAVGPPNALFCDECRAILSNAVADWHDEHDARPSTVSDRPAA